MQRIENDMQSKQRKHTLQTNNEQKNDTFFQQSNVCSTSIAIYILTPESESLHSFYLH